MIEGVDEGAQHCGRRPTSGRPDPDHPGARSAGAGLSRATSSFASSAMVRGTLVADAIRAIGVTEVTYYRWRQEYGGLKSDQIERMKALETENQRLRKAIADLTLDKLILQEAARGNF